VLVQRGEQRQEHQLSGRRACGHQPDHQSAPRREPARRNRCAEHQRGHAGAESEHEAPQHDELPDPRHAERQQQAAGEQRERNRGNATQAVAIDQRGRERPHQAEQQQPDRERRGNVGRLPAELLLQRQDEHARRADRARGDQHGEKGRCDDHPAIVNVAARERSSQTI